MTSSLHNYTCPYCGFKHESREEVLFDLRDLINKFTPAQIDEIILVRYSALTQLMSSGKLDNEFLSLNWVKIDTRLRTDEMHESDYVREEFIKITKELSSNTDEANVTDTKLNNTDTDDGFSMDDEFSNEGLEDAGTNSAAQSTAKEIYNALAEGITGDFRLIKKGLGFTYTDQIGESTSSDIVYCRNCKIGVCEKAFQARQYMIGFVGESTVGKSCLITALAYHMYNNGYSLLKTNYGKYSISYNNEQGIMRVLKEFKKEPASLSKMPPEDICLTLYENSIGVDKTSPGNNTELNVSGSGAIESLIYTLLYRDVNGTDAMYHFIDIAGESFSEKVQRNIIDSKFPAIKKCDLYVICSDDNMNDNNIGLIIENFFDYIEENNETKRKGPIILCKTKADGCDAWSPQFKIINSDSGALAVIKRMIQNKVYICEIECSAYGKEPARLPGKDEEYRHQHNVVSPKNIDALSRLIMQFTGEVPFEIPGEESSDIEHYTNLVTELCNGVHDTYPEIDDNVAWIIYHYFSNKSDIDIKRYRKINDAFGKWLMRISCRSKRKKYGEIR